MSDAGARLRVLSRLLLPGVAVLVLFLVPTVASILVGSVVEHKQALGRPTGENYLRFLGDRYYLGTLLFTLRISLVTTLCALGLGYLVAYYLVRSVRSRTVRRLAYLVVVAPLFTSSIVRSFGWMVSLGNNGIVNRTLLDLGVVERPVRLIFNEAGVVIGLTHVLLPFTVLTIAAVLQQIDASLEEAAMDLGASRLVTFLTVTLPLSLPGVVAGSLIVFTLAMSAYVTPAVLSGGRLKVVPMLIYEQYVAVYDWGFGGAMAMVLLTLTLVLTGIYTRFLRTV
ncbi:MAG TPA: ABC transporter permease [Methylomirabilota bacterium]|nr:ABC transporter permease [Methylomirabilota bacterium]